ncbi:MAG: hypothetical protein R3F17_11180 [Planctomycetota bacterium]
MVLEIAREAGFESPALVVTGGAREFLLPTLSALGLGLVEAPDLVLEGLYAAGLDLDLEGHR